MTVGVKFHWKQTNFFWAQNCAKIMFPGQSRSKELYHWFQHVKISLGQAFILKRQFSFYRPNLHKKGIFEPKSKKRTSLRKTAYSN